MKFNESHAVQLLEALPEALIIVSPEGEILFFNQAAETLTGYQSDEITNQNVSVLMPQSERRRIDLVTWLERWAFHPDPEQLRYLYLDGLTKEGEKKLYRVRVSLYPNNKDQYFLVVIRDVTEEHESSVNLRHQQLLSNRIMAIGEDAILSVDESLKIRFWNRKAADIFGYSETDILGQPLELLIPDQFKDNHDQEVMQFARGNLPSRLMGERGEIRGRHKNGETIPLEVAITKTNIDDKVVLSAQIRDISERKSAEKALKDSEARFRAVFENAFEAMALLDKNGNLIEINSAAKLLLPDKPDVKNQKFWELHWWPSLIKADELVQARDNLREEVEKALNGQSLRLIVTLQPETGNPRKIDFSLIPVVDDSGQTIHVIAEGRDITSLDA